MERTELQEIRLCRARPLLLVVDDDQDMANDLKLLLAQAFDVITCGGSSLGMRVIEEKQPDCVLLDIDMEAHFATDRRREGLVFLRRLREQVQSSQLSGIPVILISESQEPDADHGADDFFHKPIDLGPLVKRINELIKS
ncbi:MAG TPA: response regulator [candidate division Zixibacteria bacterium]|nr:response regulator [candidate division Zixibacteria bacterium]